MLPPGRCHFTNRFAELESLLCKIGQNGRGGSAKAVGAAAYSVVFLQLANLRANCRIAKVCFRLELRANLCFQIPPGGGMPAPQTRTKARDSLQTYASSRANLWVK